MLLYDPETNPNGYIDFTQALHAAKDKKVDITLRLRYAEIILVMFVDVGENRSFLDNLCYSFVSIDSCIIIIIIILLCLLFSRSMTTLSLNHMMILEVKKERPLH